jgi:hypothetical protein
MICWSKTPAGDGRRAPGSFITVAADRALSASRYAEFGTKEGRGAVQSEESRHPQPALVRSRGQTHGEQRALAFAQFENLLEQRQYPHEFFSARTDASLGRPCGRVVIRLVPANP